MRTALYGKHLSLGAKITSFAGWEMPLSYTGTLNEHITARNHVGIFDVSHMGRLVITGKEASSFLDFIATNSISNQKDGTAIYTALPNENGGSIDDTIIYKENSTSFFMIVNAANREKDKNHLVKYAQNYHVSIKDHYDSEGIIAVQGPKASLLLARLSPEAASLKPMRFVDCLFHEISVTIATTGYTGAGGFECYGSHGTICALWDWFLTEGKSLGIQPVGLGARDTLRLEMGYALYGHELSETIAPNESVSSWTVRWSKPHFLGKNMLSEIESSGKKRTQYGIILKNKGVPREGYQVLKNGEPTGYVTSGSHSPTLNQGITLIMVNEPISIGEHLEVCIRDHQVPATVVKLPFIKN